MGIRCGFFTWSFATAHNHMNDQQDKAQAAAQPPACG
jgi:hypothetical protein